MSELHRLIKIKHSDDGEDWVGECSCGEWRRCYPRRCLVISAYKEQHGGVYPFPRSKLPISKTKSLTARVKELEEALCALYRRNKIMREGPRRWEWTDHACRLCPEATMIKDNSLCEFHSAEQALAPVEREKGRMG